MFWQKKIEKNSWQDQNADLINVVVNHYADYLTNGAAGAIDDRTSLAETGLALAQRFDRAKEVAPKNIEKFKKTLEEQIVKSGKDKDYISIYSDYVPATILSKSLEKAGIKGAHFPEKHGVAINFKAGKVTESIVRGATTVLYTRKTEAEQSTDDGTIAQRVKDSRGDIKLQ